MAEVRERPLLGKVLIRGTILCETGMHIGASHSAAEIGCIDTPVLRDPITRRPYIPGSSLKGKMRSLFERKASKKFERYSGQNVWRHECADPKCEVCRLFGAASRRRDESNLPGRLIVRDSQLTPQSVEALRDAPAGLHYTEWKFENSLDRITASANPRQLERVPAGAVFDFEMVYNVETRDAQEAHKDLANTLDIMLLLQDDYLGGHGSRGYGRVRFQIAPQGFCCRSMAYYSARSEEERTAGACAPQVSDLQGCRAVIEQLLGILK